MLKLNSRKVEFAERRAPTVKALALQLMRPSLFSDGPITKHSASRYSLHSQAGISDLLGGGGLEVGLQMK